MRKSATSVQVDRAPFELKLPVPFDQKPAHEIQLPAGKRLQVYDTKTEKTIFDGNGKPTIGMVPAWRVVLVNKNGTLSSEYNNQYRRAAGVFTDPIELQLAARELAQALSKTKRTVVQEDEFGE